MIFTWWEHKNAVCQMLGGDHASSQAEYTGSIPVARSMFPVRPRHEAMRR
jgi:hypothetical protein